MSTNIEPSRLESVQKNLTFTVEFEESNNPSTKVVLGNNLETLWEQGDEINIFYGATQGSGSTFTATEVSNERKIAVFSGTISAFTGTVEGSGNAINFCGLFPYSQANTYDGTYAYMNLPHLQYARQNTEDPSSKLMIAKSPGLNLYFYLLGSGLRFEISRDDIVEFRFSGNNNEILAGDVTVGFDSNDRPVVTAVSNPQYEISVFPDMTTTTGGPAAFTPGYYFLDIIPCLMEQGYTVTYITASGQQASYSITASRDFSRTTYNTLSSKESQITFTDIPPENNQIVYFADQEIASTRFEGVGTVSGASFDNGRGVVTFANPITEIPACAFELNTDLVRIILPETVTSIGEWAFDSCEKLEDVVLPTSLTDLGQGAFAGTNLKSIDLPASLRTIGYNPFMAWHNLNRITGTGNEVWSIVDNKFLMVERESFGKTLTSAALGRFVNETITIPSNVNAIWPYAFYGGEAYGLDFSGATLLQSIERSAFQGFSLTGEDVILLPGSPQAIGPQAFADLSFPNAQPGGVRFLGDNLPNLGRYALGGNLQGQYNDTYPIWITGYATHLSSGFLGEGYWNSYAQSNRVFVYQDDDEIWYVPHSDVSTTMSLSSDLNFGTAGNPVYKDNADEFIFFTGQGTYQARPQVAFPSSLAVGYVGVWHFGGTVTAVPSSPNSDYPFRGWSFDYISLPGTTTSIGDYAFAECSNLKCFPATENVTTLGQNAFESCASLTDVTLGALSSIPDYTFANCTALQRVTFSSTSNLTAVGKQAFYNCQSLTDVKSRSETLVGVRLDAVTSIGQSAFEGTKIQAASLAAATTLDQASVFAGCRDLQTVNLPNVTAIASSCFLNRTSLNCVNALQIQTVGNYAFSGCTALETIDLPYATSLEESAFSGCTSLREIRIPKVVTIGDKCFGLHKISAFDLPAIEQIGYQAMGRNTTATSPTTRWTIHIGPNIASKGLGHRLLNDYDDYQLCEPSSQHSLELTIDATTPPTISSQSFTNISFTAIKVPSASVNDYKTAWSNYVNANYIQAQ